MKIKCQSRFGRESGSALVLTIIFLTVSLVILGAALSWTKTSAGLTERNNQYFRTVAAAEAATEKVLARMSREYRESGEATVLNNLNVYRGMVPVTTERPDWANYVFSDGSGNANSTYVQATAPAQYRVLSSQYRGLYGYASSFRLISQAEDQTSPLNINATVRQDIELASIPLFQFAIFYNLDLEIHPGPVMVVTGPVHCNTNIWVKPGTSLTFQSDVTAAGVIIHNQMPADPLTRPVAGPITYLAEKDSGVSSINLPIGTNGNNSPANVREVVEPPPAGELPTSPLGSQRYYNKADLIISVSDAGTTVQSGRYNNFATVVPQQQWRNFVITTNTFFNKRENKTVRVVDIDVANFRLWNQTNRPVSTLYVLDTRTQVATSQAGVRLVSGDVLPTNGFTVATPLPVYIKGHYNVYVSHTGSTNTSRTFPASVVGDSITILSRAWVDSNSTLPLANRVANDTTVNAALLAGIVPTVTASYSGGVENFPRFLENWSGRTFTYNGSMVVLYASRYATGLWRGTGTTIGIYNPPNRNWAFDVNFRDITKLPPSTPCARVLIRGNWITVRPST